MFLAHVYLAKGQMGNCEVALGLQGCKSQTCLVTACSKSLQI